MNTKEFARELVSIINNSLVRLGGNNVGITAAGAARIESLCAHLVLDSTMNQAQEPAPAPRPIPSIALHKANPWGVGELHIAGPVCWDSRGTLNIPVRVEMPAAPAPAPVQGEKSYVGEQIIKLTEKLKLRTQQWEEMKRLYAVAVEHRDEAIKARDIARAVVDSQDETIKQKTECILFLEKKMALMDEAAKRINELADPFYNLS